MKRYLSAVYAFGCLTILTAGLSCPPAMTSFDRLISTRPTTTTTTATTTANDSRVRTATAAEAALPLIFEENRGQTDEQVKFLARGKGYTLFLTEREAVLTFRQPGAPPDDKAARGGHRTNGSRALRLKTVGSRSPSKIEGQTEQIGTSNYLIGEDPQKWLRDVPHFAKVRFAQIYEGVDLVYYGNGRELEYDFIVQPNADPQQIALQFEGATELELSREGDLLLRLENGLMRQHKPLIYQESDGGGRVEIAGNYVLKNATEIGFEIGAYDASKPLVIDPVLAYATYLGSEEYEVSNGISFDAAGNAYVTGYANPPEFPTTPGSVLPTINNSGSQYPFVAKISADGSALLYSTYLGGAGIGIAVDAAGNAFTVGTSTSGIFTPTPGALDMGRGRVAVTKLNPQGNQIIYSARFGSSGNENPRDIAIDPAGNAYLTGTTNCGASPTSCDFPILNAPQPNYMSGDIFVSELNAAGTALVYSTYVGGSSLDRAFGIDVDAGGSAFITGDTTSRNFPTTPGAFDNTFSCNPPFICRPDAFVTRIAPNGGAFVYSTYLGGLGDDIGNGIAVDESGNAYIGGYTDGRFSGAPADGFPTTPGAFKMFGSVEGFVTKMNPTGTALVYSSLLGGIDSDCFEERINDVDIDRFGNAYVVGLTSCGSFPTVDALQPAPSSIREEAFLTKFNPTGTMLVYSTFLGGPRYDEAYNVAVQPNGTAYVTGTTSGDFQLITPGAFDTTWNGANAEHPDDIFVLKVNGLEQGRAVPADFDGDGKTDVSIYRPSVGEWWVNRSSTDQTVAAQFGLPTDLPVPGDYTGDGKTDLAFWRPATGEWFILRSENSSFLSFPFGRNEDVPLIGDFDADGKADPGVFRPATNEWFISRSSGGTSIFTFGVSGDVPVAADYDGDRKTDVAIYRPSSGEWWIQRSTAGIVAAAFGASTDKPVPGDYTGDGRADIAFFRPATGEWFILRSEDSSFYSVPFGASGDLPAPGDYDGDGKFDTAVFRPSNSTWFINRTGSGVGIVTFGTAGDEPVPGAFVP